MLARWHRQAGDDTWLLTGTDEHGQKILRTAAANGVDAAGVGRPAGRRGVEAAARDHRHRQRRLHPHDRGAARERVQKFLQELYDDGYIYAGRVRGLVLRRLRGVQAARRARRRHRTATSRARRSARSTRSPVELLQGEELLLPHERRSSDELLDLYETQPDFVQPESARNEVVAVREAGARGTCRSRARRFDWGIKVPWDESHVIYVWFDALLNYVTAVGYGVGRRASSRAAGPP